MAETLLPVLSRVAQFTAGVLCLLLAASAAQAERLEKCPVDNSRPTEVSEAVSSAPSCAQAYEVMNVCRSNSSGDAPLADIVIQKCEQVFLPTLDAPGQRAYGVARDACVRRFAHQKGPTAASFQSTCEAGVAVVFAHRADLAAMKPRRDPRNPYGILPTQ